MPSIFEYETTLVLGAIAENADFVPASHIESSVYVDLDSFSITAGLAFHSGKRVGRLHPTEDFNCPVAFGPRSIKTFRMLSCPSK